MDITFFDKQLAKDTGIKFDIQPTRDSNWQRVFFIVGGVIYGRASLHYDKVEFVKLYTAKFSGMKYLMPYHKINCQIMYALETRKAMPARIWPMLVREANHIVEVDLKTKLFARKIRQQNDKKELGRIRKRKAIKGRSLPRVVDELFSKMIDQKRLLKPPNVGKA